MLTVRIVELPPMEVVTSGPLRTQEAFDAFHAWWSAYDKTVLNKLTPRDFMWYNEREQATEWFYALPAGAGEIDCGGYARKPFSFGLYAVASNLDADCDDKKDWMDTYHALERYARESDVFALSRPENDPVERYAMFHIITPPSYFARTSIHQQDMYMPIVYKNPD